ncbi:MAG: hypothetical protein FJ145_19560 [Deltaproteobacteria bacterium]|nr:hypothetical protein [Deltaproteobacteria bacterium]
MFRGSGPCLLCGVLAAMQLWSCLQPARTVRQYTYPPEFRYISREELTSAMQQSLAMEGGKGDVTR